MLVFHLTSLGFNTHTHTHTHTTSTSRNLTIVLKVCTLGYFPVCVYHWTPKFLDLDLLPSRSQGTFPGVEVVS